MKITHIETIPIEVPLTPRLIMQTSLGEHRFSPYLLIKVHTDEGLTGLGEVTCTPNWSGEDNVTAAHLIHRYLAPQLIGENPTEIERLTRRMNHALVGNPFAKSGLEIALGHFRKGGGAAALPSARWPGA
jgi:L-alanine-DL-glutamate epimerase-like enolase superfamily enzyme